MTSTRAGEVSDPREAAALAVPASVRLLTDSQFDDTLARLMALLTRSLDARGDPEGLIEVQAELAGKLIWAQDSQKRFQQELTSTEAADRQHWNSPGTIIDVCKRLQRLVRQIADGIAWRALGYDRTTLRILAQKPHTGHMEHRSAEQEILSAATHVVRTGELVVVNDLTNFLRYGDLTAVGEDGVTIYEVKSGSGSSKSGHASRQKKKAEKVLEFVRLGSKETPDGTHKIVDLETKPRHHIEALRNIVANANETGLGSGRFSDCHFVVAVDIFKMSDKVKTGMKISDFVHSPFRQQRDAAAFDSLSLSTRFSWNVAPYSVFPLAPEDRFAIMTGKLWLVNFFSFGNLWRCLRRRGLKVSPPSEEGFAKVAGLPPGEVAARELDNPLRVARGEGCPVLSIPMSALARFFYEFLDEESFADRVEEELDLSSDAIGSRGDSPVFLHTGYVAETELWD